MNWRKLLSIFLVLCMLFSFAACGEEDYEEEEETEETEEKEETKDTEETQSPEASDPEETTAPEATTPEDTTAPEATVPEEKPTEPEELPTEPTVPEDPIPSIEPPDSSTPLLYKVTDDKGNVAWLFGSIHVGADYFYPLPEYVTSAYEGSDALAVEIDITAFENDVDALTKYLQQMLYLDGTTVKDHIPKNLFNQARRILAENDMLVPFIEYYHVTIWEQFITEIVYDKIGANSDLGIDMHFLNRAYDEGKKVISIESFDQRVEMDWGYSEPLQALLLEDAIASYNAPEAYKAGMEEMMAIWATGDEEMFSAYLNQEVTFESPEEEALYIEYVTALETNRNIVMTAFVEDSLASGEEVFVCVGAAHVVGNGAMVELLRDSGYTVTLVQE